MSQEARRRIQAFREKGLVHQSQLIEKQIRQGIPTLFAASGYPNGSYTILSLERMSETQGDYMQLTVQLTGSEQKQQNLAKALEMFMQPNMGVEVTDTVLFFRKKLQ